MKAVIYHADGPIAKNFDPGLYEKIFHGFKDNAKTWNIEVVHLTVKGHPGWGDQNFYIDGDPEHIVYNREIAWIEFLKQADPNEVYWLTEPDSRINQMWPDLECDVAMTRRLGDSVAICPAWRLATTKSIPFFEEALGYFDLNQKTWHGDSVAYVKMWHAIGCPGIEQVEHQGISIDLRNYKDYVMKKSKFSRQFKDVHKLKLLELDKNKEL